MGPNRRGKQLGSKSSLLLILHLVGALEYDCQSRHILLGALVRENVDSIGHLPPSYLAYLLNPSSLERRVAGVENQDTNIHMHSSPT